MLYTPYTTPDLARVLPLELVQCSCGAVVADSVAHDAFHASLLLPATTVVTPVTPPLVIPPVTVAPVTPAIPSGPPPKMGMSFYPGDNGSAITQMNMFKGGGYGGPYVPTTSGPNHVVLMTAVGNASDFNNSVWGTMLQAGAWKDFGANKPRLVISVPCAFGGFSPADNSAAFNAVINGSLDGSWTYLANALVAAGYKDAIIRLGWEMDGNWMPWEATHHPELYIAAFQHIHNVMKAISSAFLFDFCTAAGQSFDFTRCYPGDGYVDIIGADIYDNIAGGIHSAAQIENMIGRQRNFGLLHKKPFELGEWACSAKYGGDNPDFIQLIHDFLAAIFGKGGSVQYQSYFLGDPLADGLGLKALFHFPKAAARFRLLFT